LKTRDIEKCEFSERCATSGHLELLKWGLAQNCLLDSETAIQASKKGHLELLKWVTSQKGNILSEVCMLAACKHGNPEIVKFLEEHECKFLGRMWWYFVGLSGSVEILEYLKEKGYFSENERNSFMYEKKRYPQRGYLLPSLSASPWFLPFLSTL
jgi:hypothetical protein